ncbi:hypothetical protein TWF506_003169 [Arthrobotrys conoides]|uniref:Uncharacterized protein n=1 Tax=Arthrobotrys conoides TaxID=74498 RepID=A0AAN8RJE8_9PEZI
MHLLIYFSASLALLQATFVNGYALRLERNVTDENAMLEREWYNLKVHPGIKKCSTASTVDGFRVTGFSITNFGPEDEGFRESENAPKGWRDRLGWMGFWKNKQCQGLPTIIVHFYDVPYTRQAIYFPKLLQFSRGISMNDISFAQYGDIPFGDIWFHGNRQIPEGAVAVRETPLHKGSAAVYGEKFFVFHDAIRVINVGPNPREGRTRLDPNNQRLLLNPNDRQWENSGDLSSMEDPVTTQYIKIEEGLNISANEDMDRGMRVYLGLVPSEHGRGPTLEAPARYRNLMFGGVEDEDEEEPSDERLTQQQSGSRGQRIEEERPLAKPSLRPELQEELAAQQAAYKSFQDRSQGPSGSGSTQPSSSFQNPGTSLVPSSGTMETEPLQQSIGAVQPESEVYAGPPISESQKARSRLETVEMLSTLLERYPNWAELTADERRQRYNEFQSEKKQQTSQLLRDLVANTPNWEQLPPQERYKLYRQLDLSSNRARDAIEEEEDEKSQQETDQNQDRARLQAERSEREAKRQEREEDREKRLKEEEADNNQAVLDFIVLLNRERERARARAGLPSLSSLQSQPNAGAGGNSGSNNPAPQPNISGGTGSKNPAPSQSNVGGNTGSNNPPPQPNVSRNPNPNTLPLRPNAGPGGTTNQNNPRPPNSGGNIYPNNPSSQSINPIARISNYGLNSNLNNPPNSGRNTGPSNFIDYQRPFIPGGNMNQYSSPFLPESGSNTGQYNYNPRPPSNSGSMGQKYLTLSNAGGNANRNSSPYLPESGGNLGQSNPRPPNTNVNMGQNNQQRFNPGGNVNPYGPGPLNPGGNININNAQAQPNSGRNMNQNARPPRRWEYGSQGPGPGVGSFTSNNVNTGVNNNNANNRNTMEEEVKEEGLFQAANDDLQWGSNPLWGSQARRNQRDDDDDEFSAYQFGPRRL